MDSSVRGNDDDFSTGCYGLFAAQPTCGCRPPIGKLKSLTDHKTPDPFLHSTHTNGFNAMLRIRPLTILFVLSLTLLSGNAMAQQKGAAAQKQDAKKTGDKSTTTTDPKKAATTNSSKDGVHELTLTAGDGWQLAATYFESTSGGKESPCVILLTSTEGSDKKDARNRRVWQPTATALQKAGFAVIAVDLRKHGDSIPTLPGGEAAALKMGNADYPLMATADLEAVKAFLVDQHRSEKLNIRKLAIVSMGASSMVAATYAVADWAKEPYPDAPTIDARTPRGQDVQSLVMYSPTTNVRGIVSTNILKTLKALPVSIYIIAAKDEKEDARQAEKLFKAIELKGEQFKDSRKMTLSPGTTHAEAYLDGRLAEVTNKDLLEFLTKNVKELDAPWRDRTDRRTK
jgi:pimeloyl-ACP methyl ester carboxylesterase